MKFLKKLKLSAFILTFTITTSLIFSLPLIVNASTSSSVGVSYQAQVQKLGWQKAVKNGAEAGTEGKSLRLEALKINLIGAPAGASITYQAHVQKIGWQSAVSNGKIAGTVGKSYRIEALKITIKGLSGYAVKYRTQVQRIGWQSWQTTQNGTSIAKANIAGTVGKSLRVEAIEIEIIPVSSPTPTITSISPINVTTAAGTRPVLPATATVNYSNETTKQLAVTWDYINPSLYSSENTFTVNGTIVGSAKKAIAYVTVTKAALTIEGILPVSITTTVGVAPNLPATVTVDYSDGTTKQLAVTWDYINLSLYSCENTFTVNGTIVGSAKKAIAYVTVTKAALTIEGILPVSITTTVGVAPNLPATATAIMSDGSTKEVTVNWDAIDPSSYAAAGFFSLNGTIAESSTVTATALITVTASSNPSEPSNPSLPSSATKILQDTTISQSETINGDIIIAPNAKLTVSSGVNLIVTGNIYVYGSLYNYGTLDDSGTLYTNNYNNMFFGDSTLSTGVFYSYGHADITNLSTYFPCAYSSN